MDRFVIKTTVSRAYTPINEGASCSGSNFTTDTAKKGTNINNILSSGSEIDSEPEPPIKLAKKKVYKQKFKKEWEAQFNWLENRNNKAFCIVCSTFLNNGITHLERHSNSIGHVKKYDSCKKSTKLDDMHYFNKEKQILEKNVKIAELKLSLFIAEHNLPFRTMDHLVPLLNSILPDSEIAKNISCGRTKTSGIINNILSTENFNNTIEDMKKYPFSLIIDETTDISVSKSLAVVVRYCNEKLHAKDKFLKLLEVKSGTAEDICNSLKTLLVYNKVPFKNVIGFAADHAAVMMGSINGVQAKLKTEVNKDIFILGCICHSIHTCSSYACEKLPRSVEEFVRDTVNYFSNSAKRIKDFEEFQIFSETARHKLLKLSCTRWLSLQTTIDRILEQWDALKLYFIAEAAEARALNKSNQICDAFNNPIYEIYLLFLSYVLKIVNDMNIEFQSEKPKLYTLAPRMKELYKSILKCFIKKTVLETIPLADINPSNPTNLININELYYGAKAANKIKVSNYITSNDIQNFKLKVFDFYISLCTEIRKRFNFNCRVLNFISKFQPSEARSGRINSICDAEFIFPNFVVNIDELDNEWRILPDISQLSSIEDNDFWETVAQLKNGLNNDMFPNLKMIMKGILALPHSSAAAERVFSQLTLIKTKPRNRLYIKTVDSLLSSKQLLDESTCYKYIPPTSMLSKKWKFDSDACNEDVIL